MPSPPPSPAPTPVAIVGGGPVGLSLALGLARLGVRSVLLERNPGTHAQSRAPGIHVRTREVFRRWGVEERFLEAGVLRRELTLHPASPGRRPVLSLDYRELDREADRAGLLILEQGETERLLLDEVRATGLCDVRFGAEAVGLDPGADGAAVTFRAGGTERRLEASFVAGCDGARSFVRDALGLPFEGRTYSTRPMLADVQVEDARDELPWPRLANARGGLTSGVRLHPGRWRIIRLEGEAGQTDEVPGEEVAARVEEVLGEGAVEVVWASRFRIHRRASPRMRVGRVLLAGDAAHVHSPAGGLGMNGGIQDAHNLAWKLAAALRGGDLDALLDSYDVERRAVMVGSVSRYADVITRGFLQAPAAVRGGLFLLWRAALRLPRLRRMSLRRGTMIDLDYPASPLLDPDERAAGVRLPNPLLRSPGGGEIRLYDLLPQGPALLALGPVTDPGADWPVGDVVRIGPGGYTDPTRLLEGLLGGERGWILVRPDAHVAWAREGVQGIGAAMRRALGMGDAGTGRADPVPFRPETPSRPEGRR